MLPAGRRSTVSVTGTGRSRRRSCANSNASRTATATPSPAPPACRASGLDAMVFVSGGSEAVESALKVALQYHSARGEAGRRRFIARRRSWHGNTLGALGVSDFLDRRAPFEGALVEDSFVSQV